MRTLQLTLGEAIEICKALSNEHRMRILDILTQGPMNVNDLSEMMELPFSTAAANIKKLEDAGLISTELVPGRGMQKVSSKKYDRIVINLRKEEQVDENIITIDMPIGEFADCEIGPTCGLVSDSALLGMIDEPRSFYEPERKEAQLIWFRSGYIEYRFPNRIPYGGKEERLEIMAELCSEAPYHKLDWPSDITVWVNGIEIGTWTSPSDFGGERGLLTPKWWLTENTQYGLLKSWTINRHGSRVRMSGEIRVYRPRTCPLRVGRARTALEMQGSRPLGDQELSGSSSPPTGPRLRDGLSSRAGARGGTFFTAPRSRRRGARA